MSSVFIPSPLGPLLIEADETHVTAVTFVSSEKSKNIFKDEIIFDTPKDEILVLCAKQFEDYFEGKRTVFDFPMKPEGTDFQQLVWKGLLSIGYGKTISYMQLSKLLQNPKAIRAVGTANGSNKIVIAIPCHRVIGSNGTLVGYGGDLWRKKWLLDHEAKHANGVQKLFQ